MSYKIHTAPILDTYRTAAGCPMCELERAAEEKQIASYLGAAVMAPEIRVEVNAHGFCAEHFSRLKQGDNILGVALQAKTRLEYLAERLPRPGSKKAAAKEAENLGKETAGCVICAAVENTMNRYYETTAALFGQEVGFEPLFRGAKGYCIRHYARLRACAPYAESRAVRFSDVLFDVQQRAFAALDSDLNDFINLFDSQKPDKNRTPGALTAVDRAIRLLGSKK